MGPKAASLCVHLCLFNLIKYLQVVTVQSDEWSRLGDLAQRVAFLERLLGTAAKPAMDTMQSLLAQFSGTGESVEKLSS